MAHAQCRERTPTTNRPGRNVRHAKCVGLIDAYPITPYADSQGKLVPGLADSSAVPFQSVNYPTCYLCHYFYDLGRDANDGTPAFAADATFRVGH